MTVQNTTSTQSVNLPIAEQTGKQFDFSNATSFPLNIWIPANGKRVAVFDVVLEVINKNTTQYIGLVVQVFRGGAWRNVLGAAAGGLNPGQISHVFSGRVQTDDADGAAARIRLAKTRKSTTIEGFVLVTGEE